MDIQAILVILSCFVCTIQLVELSALRCSSNQYEHYGFCCNKCKPGTSVLTHCTNTTQTVCKTCKDGTFSSDWTSEEECTICSNHHCQPMIGLIQTCNSTVDNKCGCVKPDQFHDIATDSCRDCLSCQPGKYPVNPCTDLTICAPCPEGHFSNTTFNFRDECLKCTECEIYHRKCSSTKDSICRRKLITTPQVQSVAFLDVKQTRTTEKWKTNGSNSWKPNRSNTQKQSEVGTKIIVIVAVVVVVILVIIIIAMVYWRRKKLSYRTRCVFNGIEESIDRCQRTFSFGSLLLRDQPAKVILGLHYLLNTESSNNWRCLAAELGVPYLQILNFETNVETAAKEMLHSWGTSDSATLNRLYQALGEIGRDDACVFLEENVEMPESEETDV